MQVRTKQEERARTLAVDRLLLYHTRYRYEKKHYFSYSQGLLASLVGAARRVQGTGTGGRRRLTDSKASACVTPTYKCYHDGKREATASVSDN